ncbi:XkdX family protein [Lysinibacillus sp. NPDC096418]
MSALFNFLKRMYDEQRIDNEYLSGQVAKGRITAEQYKDITNVVYA